MNTTIYKDLLDIIKMHKSEQRSENDTELFVERMCNLIDKNFMKNNLTQEEYDNLYSELPK